MVLHPSFFQVDALDLAPRLLGKFLRKSQRPNDTACHGRFGITARTTLVFGPGGHAYVYLCYGLHTMLNIVADKERGGSCSPNTLVLPSAIGQVLRISTEWSNHPLYTLGGLEVLDGPEPEKILVGPRVGIEYVSPEAVSAPWISAPKKTLRPF